MKSVFREETWSSQRHLLNPSKFKEFELHATGLGIINKINPFKQHTERFTNIDKISQKDIDKFNKKTKLYLIRKHLSSDEKNLLEKNGFKLKKEWATLLLDTNKALKIDKGNRSIIKKGEKLLDFKEADSEEEFREYHELFKQARKSEGLKTPSIKAYSKVKSNPHYRVFIAKLDGRIVAGIGTISNENYMLQLNIAREKMYKYASDYLTYKIIDLCINKKIRWFDFAGVHPNPKEESKDYYIRKYKEKWGGELYMEYIFTR